MSAFLGSRTDEAGNHTISGTSKSGGCEIQIGTDMLFEQIPAYLEFFDFRTTMLDELRAVARIDY
jgi:shikimate dehydrogenase